MWALWSFSTNVNKNQGQRNKGRREINFDINMALLLMEQYIYLFSSKAVFICKCLKIGDEGRYTGFMCRWTYNKSSEEEELCGFFLTGLSFVVYIHYFSNKTGLNDRTDSPIVTHWLTQLVQQLLYRYYKCLKTILPEHFI